MTSCRLAGSDVGQRCRHRVVAFIAFGLGAQTGRHLIQGAEVCVTLGQLNVVGGAERIQ